MSTALTTPAPTSLRTSDLLPLRPPPLPVIEHAEGLPPLATVRPTASPALVAELVALARAGYTSDYRLFPFGLRRQAIKRTGGLVCFRCQGAGVAALATVPCSCCLGKGRTP